MNKKQLLDRLTIYIPQPKLDMHPVERLIEIGEARHRSVSHLVIEAILQYLEREEETE